MLAIHGVESTRMVRLVRVEPDSDAVTVSGTGAATSTEAGRLKSLSVAFGPTAATR